MIGYVGLLKIELPDHTAYLSDGGFIEYDGDTYTSYDSVLGSIAGIEPMSEGGDGQIPALGLSFHIPSVDSITALSSGALQQSTVKLWLAEYTVETGLISGTPDLQFLGQIDQPVFKIAKGEFSCTLAVVSKAEWFFEKDIGNGLSSAFHKDLYPGETGHDNATGLQVAVAWGAASPPRGGGSGSGFSGGGGIFRALVNQ